MGLLESVISLLGLQSPPPLPCATVRAVVFDPEGFGLSLAPTSLQPTDKFDWAYGPGRDAVLPAEAFCSMSGASDPIAFCGQLRRVAGAIEYSHQRPCRAYTDDGVLVSELGQIREGGGVWVVPSDRVFLWPSVRVGHITNVTVVSGHDIALETIALQPKLFRLKGFISDQEVDQLVANAKRLNLERSTGGLKKKGAKGNNQGDVTDRRTSTNAWDLSSSLAMTIKRRSFELLRIHTFDRAWTDGLQIVHYDPGQFYHSHNDFFDPKTMPTGGYNFDPATGGVNRLATVFIYLSDTDIGGETVFPNAVVDDQWVSEAKGTDEEATALLESLYPPAHTGLEREMALECRSKLAVVPRKGDAVLFYHQDSIGNLDFHALHGACPPLRGEKWGANLWVWNGPVWQTDMTDTPLVGNARASAFTNGFGQLAYLNFIDQENKLKLVKVIKAGETATVRTRVGDRYALVVDKAVVSSWTISSDTKQVYVLSPSAPMHVHAHLEL